MKGLFKSKPRTPTDVVRQTRELLIYIDLHYNSPDPKREEKESSKNIQIEAFHVFKLFAANKNKPPEIVTILVTNRSKLLRLLAGFKIDKEDEQFEADKEQVIKLISAL